MFKISIILFSVFFVKENLAQETLYTKLQITNAKKSLERLINNKSLESIPELTNTYPFYNDNGSYNEIDSLFLANSGKKNIHLRRWTFFPLTQMATSHNKKIHIPNVINKRIENYKKFSLKWNKYGEKEKLWNLLLNSLKEKGYTLSILKSKNAHSLLSIARELTKDRLSYSLVDDYFDNIHEPSFYWKLGKGDCDKYASLSASIYYLLKEKTENNEHLYVFSGDIVPPKKTIAHAWNNVIGVNRQGNWYISAYDLTFADDSFFSYFDGAVDETHVDKNTWKVNFYSFINDPYGIIASYLEIDWEDLTCNQISNISEKTFDALYKIGWHDTLTYFHSFWDKTFEPSYCVKYQTRRYQIIQNIESVASAVLLSYINEDNINMIKYTIIKNLDELNFFEETSRKQITSLNNNTYFMIKLLTNSKSTHKDEIMRSVIKKCTNKQCKNLIYQMFKH